MLRRLSFDERSARLCFIERKHELNPTFHDPVSFLQITLTSNRYNITLVVLVEEFEIIALRLKMGRVEDSSGILK